MYDVIADALDNYLQNALPSIGNLPVAWEGVSYMPSANNPYLRVTLSGYQRSPAGVGPNTVNVESGVYTVSIVYPVGSGRGAASGIAQQLAEIFPRGQSITLAGQSPLVIINASAAPTITDGSWMTIPVSVYWITTEPAQTTSA